MSFPLFGILWIGLLVMHEDSFESRTQSIGIVASTAAHDDDGLLSESHIKLISICSPTY
jgi:hypothetical protein